MNRRPQTSARFLLGFMLLFVLMPVARSQEPRSTDGAKRPHVLVTNDDGIDAKGIRALIDELSTVADVVVAAPKSGQSGAGQALMLSGAVTVEKRGSSKIEEWAIDATPATCVLLALEHLNGGRKFDIVVSGINSAENVGSDVFASGTVGAARMAADLGYPAIALSVRRDGSHLKEVAAAARRLVFEAVEKKLPGGHVLNVNFPKGASDSWKTPLLTFGAARGFDVVFREGSAASADAKDSKAAAPPKTDDAAPAVRTFRASIRLHRGTPPTGSDTWALAKGHVSVTLLRSMGASASSNAQFGGIGSLARWGFFR
jgi:5'-nucleotidase